MSAAHSKLGASGMYRWAACPGSVRKSEGIASVSSIYAKEGTAAHALGDHMLKNPALTKYALLGHSVWMNEFRHTQISLLSPTGWNEADTERFEIDEEMADAVGSYVDYIRDILRQHPDAILLTEQRFDLSSVYPGCFGTADAVIWIPSIRLLIVIDYKHGAGIAVEVLGNPQLSYYQLGALLNSKYPAARVRGVIVQPRCYHNEGPIRSVEIDAMDLLDFRADLKQYAIATAAPDAPLVPGAHCKFCPAAATCEALAGKAQAAAKLEFSQTTTYDPEKLKLALDSREAVKAWLKSLDEFAYAEAEAGRVPPGYKLVEKRKPPRKWLADGDVIQFLQDSQWRPETYMEPASLRSVAQLEEIGGKAWYDQLKPFVVQPPSARALVPEGDKRASVKAGPKAEFTAVPAQAIEIFK